MPPPPPPPLASVPTKTAPKTDRNALLSDIHKGLKLKKTVTNDRSGPLLAGKIGNNNTNTTTNINGGNNANNKFNGSSNSSNNAQRPILPSSIRSNPTEQLNSMFAGGFPKKPSEMKNMLNKPVSSPPINRVPSPEVKKVNLPTPPVIKPKPGGYSNSSTLQKKNGSSVTSLKDEVNTNTIKPRPGGPPPPPPPKKFTGQSYGGSSGTISSQGIPPPPIPPPVFNRPLPTALSNPIPPKPTNDSGAASPIRPPPPPPQRLQSIPQVSTNQSSIPSAENFNENKELNNNSKVEKLIEAFYSRFAFIPLQDIPPPPEFKNIPKEYPTYKKKMATPQS